MAGIAERAAGCPVVHLDFSEPKEFGCHWKQAAELREAGAAYFNEFAQGYWIFTRHDAVQSIYKETDIFSSESITPWEPDPIYRFVPTQVDPPEHIKYRRILNPWFSAAAMAERAPQMKEICTRLVAELAPRGACDFVSDFALRYPTEVFLDVVGVPQERADDFVSWVDEFFTGFGGAEDGKQAMADSVASIRGYWEEALKERRGEAEPRPGDLASYLMHATYEDRPLTETELLDILLVLVLAGLDTTRGELGFMFRHLAEHPEHRRALIEDPSLIPTAVEEIARFYPIIFGEGRKVARDVEFHGVQLKKGDMVYGLVSGANRDPRVYERPEEFVIDRKRSPHLGFATGPHQCLGIHLARRELRTVLEVWLAQIPDFRIATEEPLKERGGGNMLALFSLPLEWEPAG
jgi:cytochrome P450